MKFGTTYVHGKDPATARILLNAATRAGVPQDTVSVTDGGFIVPDAVWDVAEADLSAPQEPF